MSTHEARPPRRIGRRSEIGYELRLRHRGVGGSLGASLLATSLCGWIVGEAFAL
jgi:hypothetical protein